MPLPQFLSRLLDRFRTQRERGEDRERTLVAALVALIGAAMIIAGTVALAGGSAMSTIGWALIGLGVVAVFQAVVIGLGLWKP